MTEDPAVATANSSAPPEEPPPSAPPPTDDPVSSSEPPHSEAAPRASPEAASSSASPIAEWASGNQADAVSAPPAGSTNGPLESLEHRVRRLEETIESFQDTKRIEERVVERVARRLTREKKKESAGVVIDSNRVFLPATIAPVAAPSAAAEPVAEPQLSATTVEPTAPPVAAVVQPPTAIVAEPPTAIVATVPTARVVEPPVASVAAPPAELRRSFLWRPAWAVFDALGEALAILRMFIDPHYRMSWSARLVPLVLLAAILTSWVWLPGTGFLHSIPGISVFATIYDKAVDLVLAFFLYKILSREARRYRDVFPHLAGSDRR